MPNFSDALRHTRRSRIRASMGEYSISVRGKHSYSLTSNSRLCRSLTVSKNGLLRKTSNLESLLNYRIFFSSSKP